MRGLLSWFVVQLMPDFSLIDSELGDGWAPPARGSLAGWSCDVTSPEGGVLIPCSFRLLSRRRLGLAMCCLPRCSLSSAMSV